MTFCNCHHGGRLAIILECVPLTTYFDDDKNDNIGDKHMHSRVLVRSAFIINELNDSIHQLLSIILMVLGEPNCSYRYLFLVVLFGLTSLKYFVIIIKLSVTAADSGVGRENVVFQIRRGGLDLVHMDVNDL